MVPIYAQLVRNALQAADRFREAMTERERKELDELRLSAREVLADTASKDVEIPSLQDLRIDWDDIGDAVDQFVPGIGQVFTRGPQIHRDTFEAITRSVFFIKDVFLEQWEAFKDHWPEFLQVMLGLLVAELGVAALAAAPDPTMATKIAALALQAMLIAFAVHAVYTAGKDTLAYANAFWTNVQVANGDVNLLNQAALNFVRMLFSIASAIAAVLGLRKAVRRPSRGEAGKPVAPRRIQKRRDVSLWRPSCGRVETQDVDLDRLTEGATDKRSQRARTGANVGRHCRDGDSFNEGSAQDCGSHRSTPRCRLPSQCVQGRHASDRRRRSFHSRRWHGIFWGRAFCARVHRAGKSCRRKDSQTPDYRILCTVRTTQDSALPGSSGRVLGDPDPCTGEGSKSVFD